MAQVAGALRCASQSDELPWMAKAYFRRGLAKEKLKYLTDAIADFEAAAELEPTDATIAKQLHAARARKHKAELKPTQMFAGILQRERAEREREEAAADLAARKQRREERLQREAALREADKATEVDT
ncbi:unnamed protein product [Symbiodinium natans]|uniref:Uncharacterized protein n=1 Tax=Symbiodinium natans TaxID=878477 RepID=A0A812V5H9_9DINO|nr:unnamed protein product [Symbiodinium natans]